MMELTTMLVLGTRRVVYHNVYGAWQRHAVVWSGLEGAVIRQIPYIGDHIMEKP